MPKRAILCVRWLWKGIAHYEPLQPYKTIDSGLDCQQITRLQQTIEKIDLN